jgi:transcription elongation factor Elf1
MLLGNMKKCDVCGYRGIASTFVHDEDAGSAVKCPTCGSEQEATARPLSSEMDDFIQKMFSVPGYKRPKRSRAKRLSYVINEISANK